jgi:superoxide dismutase, Cu-Zn family
MKISRFLSCVAVGALASMSLAKPAGKPVVVEIKNGTGQSIGTATLTDGAPSGVHIKLDVKSLPPGEHSIHIHQFAKCDGPDFKTAGPHFTGAAPGHDHSGAPAGDIPNFVLVVGPDGTAHVSVEAPNVTLGSDDHSVFSNGGTALVIHAVKSETDGGAPPRIACGVIAKPE